MFNFDFKEMLTTGAKGEAVETLQKALQATGFDPGKADGLFGEKTKAALTQFQQKAGLDADGVFGPKSKEAVQKFITEQATEKAGEFLEKKFGAVGGLFGKK